MSLSDLALPFLRCLQPETAHNLTLRALQMGLGPVEFSGDDGILRTSVWDRDFPNPIGLSAGFDKNAEVTAQMLNVGLGFVEVGSITPRPQPGNPKPRIFRLAKDEAVINRLGFNNHGADYAAANLKRRGAGIIGVNLGKNKDSDDAAEDYAIGTRKLAPYADYLVINVSSPNTPGLRALQGQEELTRLIEAVKTARAQVCAGKEPPLLVKIAPDLTGDDLQDIAAVARDTAIDGLIVSNTTITRPDNLKSGAVTLETGGLSGRPLFDLSTRVLSEVYRLTGGELPLIGVGGIASGEDAYAKIRAGASLVQLYTALIYQGPSLIPRIKRELAECLHRDGFQRVADAVGTNAKS